MDTEIVDQVDGGRRVLIIDDNEDLALSQAILLQCCGCLVEVAHDGREGARLAVQKPFDVVFIDIGMPGMSGYEVVKAIRAALDDPPVLLAQTAYGRPEDARRARAAGFDAHLVKPVDPEVIIRHALHGREALGRRTPKSEEDFPSLDHRSRNCLSA